MILLKYFVMKIYYIIWFDHESSSFRKLGEKYMGMLKYSAMDFLINLAEGSSIPITLNIITLLCLI